MRRPYTSIFTDFIFAFGNQQGRLPDNIIWTSALGDGTSGQFTFEILTGLDEHPLPCGVSTGCGSAFAVESLTLVSANFQLTFLDVGTSYSFLDLTGNIVQSGLLTVTRQVAEPSTQALLVLGALLLALGVGRQRVT